MCILIRPPFFITVIENEPSPSTGVSAFMVLNSGHRNVPWKVGEGISDTRIRSSISSTEMHRAAALPEQPLSGRLESQHPHGPLP